MTAGRAAVEEQMLDLAVTARAREPPAAPSVAHDLDCFPVQKNRCGRLARPLRGCDIARGDTKFVLDKPHSELLSDPTALINWISAGQVRACGCGSGRSTGMMVAGRGFRV